MKILLIQPPVRDFYDTEIRLQPLGLAYLKAALIEHMPDLQVRILDFHHGHGRRTLKWPKELEYLGEYYPFPDRSPFSTFHSYFHFGADDGAIARRAAEEKPDLVGISSLFTAYHREALHTAAIVKQATGATIVMGGSHVSAMPESVLAHPQVDYIIRGEGERPMVELVRALRRMMISQNESIPGSELPWSEAELQQLRRVPGLGYRAGGAIHLNPLEDNFPIDEIPVPDFSDFPVESRRYGRLPLAFILSSRGCPYHCSFCSVHTTFGKRYRQRSPEEVHREIHLRYAQGYRILDFEDDNLTFRTKGAKRLFQMIIDEPPGGVPAGSPGAMEFLAMNGVSHADLDGELLGLMRRAGFTHLNLSLVTGSAALRRTSGRPRAGLIGEGGAALVGGSRGPGEEVNSGGDLDHYRFIVRRAHELGFRIVSYQILGLPGESLDSMGETLALQASLPVLMGASVFYRVPGSPLESLFSPPDERDLFLGRLSAMAVESDLASRDEIYTLFIATRILNFLKGLSIPEPQVAQVGHVVSNAHPFSGGRRTVSASDDSTGQTISLGEALRYAAGTGGRTSRGAEILSRLREAGILYGDSPEGLRPIPRFRAGLFFQLLERIPFLMTQEGRRIRLK